MTLENFLIDFENVQPAGIGRLTPGNCKIWLFLGQTQSKAPVELVRTLQPFGADVTYLTISGTGPNAVYFHIAFYIGRLALTHPGAQFNIVSRDTGFDPLVKHMWTLGIACRRIKDLPGGAGVARPTKAVTDAVVPAAGDLVDNEPTVAASLPAVVPKESVSKPAPPRKAAAKATKNVKITILPAASPKPAAKSGAVAAPELVKIVESAIARLKGLKSAKPARLTTLESSLSSWSKPPLDTTKVALVLADLQRRKLLSLDGNKVIYRLG